MNMSPKTEENPVLSKVFDQNDACAIQINLASNELLKKLC